MNAAGDRTDKIQCNAAGDITRSTHRDIDALGLTESVHGADPAETVSCNYAIERNLRVTTVPLHANPTEQRYDALDRLTTTGGMRPAVFVSPTEQGQSRMALT